MPEIAIIKSYDSGLITPGFLEHARATTDLIRERAFNIFEKRRGVSGSDLDDWLQAERDVVWAPPSELVDDGKAFKAVVALPGFDAGDVQMSATPDALVIEAEAIHTHDGETGNVCFCEFSDKQLFRRLDLPAPIDVDNVSASLDKGILTITAKSRPDTRDGARRVMEGSAAEESRRKGEEDL